MDLPPGKVCQWFASARMGLDVELASKAAGAVMAAGLLQYRRVIGTIGNMLAGARGAGVGWGEVSRQRRIERLAATAASTTAKEQAFAKMLTVVTWRRSQLAVHKRARTATDTRADAVVATLQSTRKAATALLPTQQRRGV